MHQSRHKFACFRLPVIIDTLNQSTGTIADTNYSHINITQVSVTLLSWNNSLDKTENFHSTSKRWDFLATNSEDLGATFGADALCGWSPILQGNPLGILDFHLLAAFETICWHSLPPPFNQSKLYPYYKQAVKPLRKITFKKDGLKKNLLRLPLPGLRIKAQHPQKKPI